MKWLNCDVQFYGRLLSHGLYLGKRIFISASSIKTVFKFLQQRSGFDPRSDCVGFLVDEVEREVFL
jgi:hypothetical protein